MLNITSVPMLVVIVAAGLVGGLIGGFIGQKALKSISSRLDSFL